MRLLAFFLFGAFYLFLAFVPEFPVKLLLCSPVLNKLGVVGGYFMVMPWFFGLSGKNCRKFWMGKTAMLLQADYRLQLNRQ